MPRLVVPILRAPRISSDSASSARWCGRMRCARSEITRLSSIATPCPRSSPISFSRAQGSMTMPLPMTQRMPGCRMPEGMRCSTNFFPSTMTVWPGVVAAVEAGHHLHLGGEQVHDLALALVAPLGAGDHDVRHGFSGVRRSAYSRHGRAGQRRPRRDGLAFEGVAALARPAPRRSWRRAGGRGGTGRSACRRCGRCTGPRRRCPGRGSGTGSCSRPRSGCTRRCAWRGAAPCLRAGRSPARSAAPSPSAAAPTRAQSAMSTLCPSCQSR